MKQWGKLFHANYKQQRVGGAIILSDKIEFKSNTLKRENEEYYILLNVSNHLEDI